MKLFALFRFYKGLSGEFPGGGGVHNMLRILVCATHMGRFLA